jgi:hypothetical protein
MTANGESEAMRKIAMLLAVLSLAVSAGSAGAAGSVPPFPRLAGAWSHAEINVTIRKQVHTLILDRGRIIQVGAAQLTLRERDKTVVVVPLSTATLVNIMGSNATIFFLRRGMHVQTMRIDGGAAVRVRVTG